MKFLWVFDFDWEDVSSLFDRLFHGKDRFTKENVQILFVDDEVNDFDVINNLKEAGWSVIGVEDIKNVDEDIVKRSQIIFVDFKGVGRSLSQKEQGIGLIKLIKNTYGKKKRLILYSGHASFSLDDNFKAADDWLSKNSDTREFIDKIKENMRELR
ncbi:MAG: hypothetical protein ACD_19C00168G0004 [uncultured bacterium]|uniref:Response regulatory domain-containing protein n=1 Tax=Candidatus Collierbacteria bacterium GW2011_GWE1_46_18 TaxID=1618399 RepID=A0A0G1P459_9BACT|nr:MAG: hypothetical protein ACD_19C00168G0004 [uncultured bacterium]KKU27536.1 MAG: hypothetical protein UX41_C0048G0002 [Candidatus Collierbacteria bacterium GW2011_GWE1_46_18]HCR36127.1 hypothetical protein [Candidatus Woesebacteria bacterium]